MDEGKRKKLEAAGWVVGDVADFLGLSDAEMRLIDLRLGIARAIREAREARNLTQRQLAVIMKTSQPRVAKIEQAAPDVSLDLMLRGFFAIGGQLSARLEPIAPTPDEAAPRAKHLPRLAATKAANALEKSVFKAEKPPAPKATKATATKRPRKTAKGVSR